MFSQVGANIESLHVDIYFETSFAGGQNKKKTTYVYNRGLDVPTDAVTFNPRNVVHRRRAVVIAVPVHD